MMGINFGLKVCLNDIAIHRFANIRKYAVKGLGQGCHLTMHEVRLHGQMRIYIHD